MTTPLAQLAIQQRPSRLHVVSARSPSPEVRIGMASAHSVANLPFFRDSPRPAIATSILSYEPFKNLPALLSKNVPSAVEPAPPELESFDKTYALFPWSAAEEVSLSRRLVSDADLLEELGALSGQVEASGALVDYLSIRNLVCGINLELDRRARVSPKFRFLRRPPSTYSRRKLGTRTVGESALGTDRQVFDLHWLSHRGFTSTVHKKPEFARLFAGGILDKGLAVAFASVPAPIGEKVHWLGLDPKELRALELDTLQTPTAGLRWYRILNGELREGSLVQVGFVQVAGKFRRDACGNVTRERHAESRARAWACLRLADGDVEKARQLHATWEGMPVPIERRNFSRMAKTAVDQAPTPSELA